MTDPLTATSTFAARPDVAEIHRDRPFDPLMRADAPAADFPPPGWREALRDVLTMGPVEFLACLWFLMLGMGVLSLLAFFVALALEG